jgi:hypothetical protein
MKKYYLLLIPLLFVPIFIFAQSLDDISYPIEELGNCQNKEECSSFCDKTVNLEACLNFSKENKLLADCDLVNARSFLDHLNSGVKLLPCESKTECLDFCSKEENLDQCLAFAEKSGILSRGEVLLFKRTKGVGPGDCKTKEECKEYCSKAENVDECLAYAENFGFMTQEQVAEAVRLRDVALDGGPGGCIGLEQCKDYCSKQAHFNECINFGKDTGIITSEEEEQIQQFVKQGGPGGCKTRQECDVFCTNPDNIKQCLGYLIDNNYLPQEYVEVIKQSINDAQDRVNQQLEDYKQKYNLDDEQTEQIRKQIEKEIQPFKDILNIK